MHRELPSFISTRGGIARCARAMASSSWLNRLLLPDTVGTGGDSTPVSPIGISFPAGSGLVAFAAATGVMPLDMPESCAGALQGKMQPGITLRDLVNAIPLYAIKQGLLTVEEGQEERLLRPHPGNRRPADLKVEQTFELTDAAAVSVPPPPAPSPSTKAPIVSTCGRKHHLMKWMIAEGYQDARTCAAASRPWKSGSPSRHAARADADADYAAVIEIDLADVRSRSSPARTIRTTSGAVRSPATRSTKSSSARA